jgi:hypothetical protein
MKEYPEFIRNIDWQLIREQKKILLELSSFDYFTGNTHEAFEGILGILDALQDFAVDEMGIDENEVFNFETIE